MTQLSRTATLGIGKEGSTPGVYVPPVWAVPFEKADFEDAFDEIKDTSYRGNDTTLQGMYQGPGQATWDIDTWAYPDLTGVWLRGIIGPDTVTAGVSTQVATGGSSQGANNIPSVATIPTGSTIQIGTGATQEWAITGVATGSGPYTIPITTPATGLLYAHLATEAILSQSTHTFKQSPTTPHATWSLTVYDTLQTLEYTSAVVSDLEIKIDPKGALAFNAKLTSFPFILGSTTAETYTQVQPLLGWQWAMTNGGASSTRGLTYDIAIKRAVEAIHASNGSQNPREIFGATLDSDGTYKAIFENQTDLGLYLNYTQQPATALLAAPLAKGGYSLALTMSQSGWYKGMRDLSQGYVQANFSLSGIYNSTDGGAISAVLKTQTRWGCPFGPNVTLPSGPSTFQDENGITVQLPARR